MCGSSFFFRVVQRSRSLGEKHAFVWCRAAADSLWLGRGDLDDDTNFLSSVLAVSVWGFASLVWKAWVERVLRACLVVR